MKIIYICDNLWINPSAVVALVPARNGEECDIFLAKDGDGKPVRVGKSTTQVANLLNAVLAS